MKATQKTLFDSDELAGCSARDQYYDEPLRRSRHTPKYQAEANAGRKNRNEVFESTMPRHQGDAERITARLRTLGPRGATRDELCVQLNMPLPTVCGRVRDLLDAAKPLIEETTERRETRTGSRAVVLRHK